MVVEGRLKEATSDLVGKALLILESKIEGALVIEAAVDAVELGISNWMSVVIPVEADDEAAATDDIGDVANSICATRRNGRQLRLVNCGFIKGDQICFVIDVTGFARPSCWFGCAFDDKPLLDLRLLEEYRRGGCRCGDMVSNRELLISTFTLTTVTKTYLIGKF